MKKMTSAYANKLLKKLAEDKEYWRGVEDGRSTYVAAINEEPVVPDYDYATVAGQIEAIDEQIVKIKHAINVNNASNQIEVGQTKMCIDEILIKMAQLNRRKQVLDTLRKHSPKVRVSSGLYSRNTTPEYEYINYDLDLVNREYLRIDEEIAAMQLALDKYNQTFEFEVQI